MREMDWGGDSDAASIGLDRFLIDVLVWDGEVKRCKAGFDRALGAFWDESKAFGCV